LSLQVIAHTIGAAATTSNNGKYVLLLASTSLLPRLVDCGT